MRLKLSDISYRSPVRNSLPGLFFRASTSTHCNNDYIAIITECKRLLFKKKKFVCGFNSLCQRVHVLMIKKKKKKKKPFRKTFQFTN